MLVIALFTAQSMFGFAQTDRVSDNSLAKAALSASDTILPQARLSDTIKSSQLREGLAKFEWEKEIAVADAHELMQLCLPGIISKTRYILPADTYETNRYWEVDVFDGRLEGLILAEIELGSEEETFDKPEWLGEEVTGQAQYYNANM